MKKGTYHHSEETKKKMSEAHKGKLRLDMIGKKLRLGKENKWGFHSEETKKKMSENNCMNREEVRKKVLKHLEKLNLSKKNRHFSEEHPNWKGNSASKSSLHLWVRKNKPKSQLCENCKEERKLSLANIKNHKYTRNIDDYKWICYPCHKNFDLKNSELKCLH
jgi:hypothetical protein